jgi:hypothetical protein
MLLFELVVNRRIGFDSIAAVFGRDGGRSWVYS